jgi:hypothetical protein
MYPFLILSGWRPLHLQTNALARRNNNTAFRNNPQGTKAIIKNVDPVGEVTGSGVLISMV